MPQVVRFHTLGGPEVLQFDEVAFGEPAPGELRLKIGAIGLNRMESVYRQGFLGTPTRFPAVLGSEGAGIVEAIGEGVAGFRVGDRVATIPGFTTVPGFATAPGGHECAVYGERAFVPAAMAVKLPDDLSFAAGASLWMQYTTAYSGLIQAADLRAGEHVLITAATASVGLAACQVATALGAHPIATTRSSRKVVALRALGIADVIVTDEQDIATEVARITDGAGCRVIFDPVAGEGVNDLLDALSFGGTIVLYGALAAAPSTIDPVRWLAKAAAIKFATQFEVSLDPARRTAMIDFVLQGLAQGVLRPVIDRTFPLAEIVEAHRYLDANQHVGKIVVTVD